MRQLVLMRCDHARAVQRVVTLFLGSGAVGLVVTKRNTAVLAHQKQVDRALYVQKLAYDQLLDPVVLRKGLQRYEVV